MENIMRFGEVLEAADKLSVQDQESLLDILRRRLVEHQREEIAGDIREARTALAEGRCHPSSPQEIFDEIAS